jgi:hypothetical protein
MQPHPRLPAPSPNMPPSASKQRSVACFMIDLLVMALDAMLQCLPVLFYC